RRASCMLPMATSRRCPRACAQVANARGAPNQPSFSIRAWREGAGMTDIPSIAEAGAAIAAGRLSPVALTESCLARTERHEKQLHSFIRLERDRALGAARMAEAEIKAGRWRGDLHGIPFAHKDIYQTAGIPTTAHSKLLIDHVPACDATTVTKLAEA